MRSIEGKPITPKMAGRIRFALIGASSIALRHGCALKRCPDTELVKVYSRNPERAKRLAGTLGVGWTTRYEDILDDRRIEALDITTEPKRHVALALPAWQQGKHLLIEKPLDEDLQEALRFTEMVEGSGQCVSVVSPKRFNPVITAIKREVDAGTIGRLLSASIVMMLKRDVAYYQHGSGWRSEYGSVLMNQGVHWIDVLIWILGFPVEVRATLTRYRMELATYDTGVVWAQHPRGVCSTLLASTSCARTSPEEFVMYGETGTLNYRTLNRVGRSTLWKPLGLCEALRCRLGSWNLRRQGGLLGAQITDVARSIRTGTPPTVSVRDGYNALRFVKLCEQVVVDTVLCAQAADSTSVETPLGHGGPDR